MIIPVGVIAQTLMLVFWVNVMFATMNNTLYPCNQVFARDGTIVQPRSCEADDFHQEAEGPGHTIDVQEMKVYPYIAWPF